jgi:hypothetical protein
VPKSQLESPYKLTQTNHLHIQRKMIISEDSTKYDVVILAIAGAMLTSCLSSIAICQLRNVRKRTFFFNSLLARVLLFNIFSNLTLLKLLVINTVPNMTQVSHALRGIDFVLVPTVYCLDTVTVSLILSLAYAIYKGYRHQVIKTIRPLNALYVSMALSTSLLGIIYVWGEETSLLYRFNVVILDVQFEVLATYVHDIQTYFSGVGSIASSMILVLISVYLHSQGHASIKLYQNVIKLNISFIIFRLPGLVLATFPFSLNISLSAFVLECFHGVVDSIIICNIH